MQWVQSMFSHRERQKIAIFFCVFVKNVEVFQKNTAAFWWFWRAKNAAN